MRMRLAVVLLAALPGANADVGFACMDHGRARVPCHDELRLARADKFLLTLVGHSCYSLAVAAPQPLEVYLYDDSGGLQAINSSAIDAIAALGGVEQPLVSMDPHLCQGTQTCSQVREGLSPSTVYSLVIARSRGGDADTEDPDEEMSVLLDLQHCDPLSSWHYFGLVMVGMLGFTSVLLLLCLIGEFVLGLRSVTKLRKSVDKIRFIELAQLDPAIKTVNAASREDPDEDDATVLISESESEDSSPRPATENDNDDSRLLSTGRSRDVDQV